MDVVKLVAAICLAGVASPVAAAPHEPWAQHIAEASARFGVPEGWIRTVMRIESRGDPTATSTAGAMGLMQIMPATWAHLTARYRLGDNPYDPRSNTLAGAAYLRELYDRYGAPAFLAAYNAGPGRLDAWLLRGRPLPIETRRYVVAISPAIGSAPAALPHDQIAQAEPPALFAVRHDGSAEAPPATEGAPSAGLFAVRREPETAPSDVQPD